MKPPLLEQTVEKNPDLRLKKKWNCECYEGIYSEYSLSICKWS